MRLMAGWRVGAPGLVARASFGACAVPAAFALLLVAGPASARVSAQLSYCRPTFATGTATCGKALTLLPAGIIITRPLVTALDRAIALEELAEDRIEAGDLAQILAFKQVARALLKPQTEAAGVEALRQALELEIALAAFADARGIEL